MSHIESGMVWIFAVMLGLMLLVIAIGFAKMGDIQVIDVTDPSVICEEDEAWWWIGPDTKGCVHYEVVCDYPTVCSEWD